MVHAIGLFFATSAPGFVIANYSGRHLLLDAAGLAAFALAPGTCVTYLAIDLDYMKVNEQGIVSRRELFLPGSVSGRSHQSRKLR